MVGAIGPTRPPFFAPGMLGTRAFLEAARIVLLYVGFAGKAERCL